MAPRRQQSMTHHHLLTLLQRLKCWWTAGWGGAGTAHRHAFQKFFLFYSTCNCQLADILSEREEWVTRRERGEGKKRLVHSFHFWFLPPIKFLCFLELHLKKIYYLLQCELSAGLEYVDGVGMSILGGRGVGCVAREALASRSLSPHVVFLERVWLVLPLQASQSPSLTGSVTY